MGSAAALVSPLGSRFAGSLSTTSPEGFLERDWRVMDHARRAKEGWMGPVANQEPA
jgi:hypothetical protein